MRSTTTNEYLCSVFTWKHRTWRIFKTENGHSSAFVAGVCLVQQMCFSREKIAAIVSGLHRFHCSVHRVRVPAHLTGAHWTHWIWQRNLTLSYLQRSYYASTRRDLFLCPLDRTRERAADARIERVTGHFPWVRKSNKKNSNYIRSISKLWYHGSSGRAFHAKDQETGNIMKTNRE